MDPRGGDLDLAWGVEASWGSGGSQLLTALCKQQLCKVSVPSPKSWLVPVTTISVTVLGKPSRVEGIWVSCRCCAAPSGLWGYCLQWLGFKSLKLW